MFLQLTLIDGRTIYIERSEIRYVVGGRVDEDFRPLVEDDDDVKTRIYPSRSGTAGNQVDPIGVMETPEQVIELCYDADDRSEDRVAELVKPVNMKPMKPKPMKPRGIGKFD